MKIYVHILMYDQQINYVCTITMYVGYIDDYVCA